MKRNPIILFVAPPDCGKTMAVYSLAEYLAGSDEGYFEVKPNRAHERFDETYLKKCDIFEYILNKNLANKGTDTPRIAMPKTEACLMIDVLRNKKLVYQILEAPGEELWDPEQPENNVGSQIMTLIDPKGHERGQVIFVLLLDFYTYKWVDKNYRENDQGPKMSEYINRLKNIIDDNFKSGDKVIALFNQYDKAATGDWKLWEQAYSGLFANFASQKRLIFLPKISVKKLAYSSGKNFEEQIDPKTNQEKIDPKTNLPIILYKSGTDVTGRDGYAHSLWKEINRKFTWL